MTLGVLPGRGVGRGFTLIELLVVIAIIALLVSLLMPSLQQAKEMAKKSACAAHLKQVGTGLNMYIPDNDYWMPGLQDLAYPYPGGYTAPDGTHYPLLRRGILHRTWVHPDVESRPVRDGDGFLGAYTTSTKSGRDAIQSCPAVKRGGVMMRMTYGGGSYLAEAWGEKTFALNHRGVTEWGKREGYNIYVETRASNVEFPAMMMYMADSLGHEPGLIQGAWDNPESNTAATPTPRHFGEFQMVFCDGHVESGPLDVFYRPEYMYNPNTIPKH